MKQNGEFNKTRMTSIQNHLISPIGTKQTCNVSKRDLDEAHSALAQLRADVELARQRRQARLATKPKTST